MATLPVGPQTSPANMTLHDITGIAVALRRLNEIDSAPVLSAEDRAEIARAKVLCWQTIGEATEALVSLLDALAGDPDIEANGDEDDGSHLAEDEFMILPGDGYPGCPIGDPGGCEHDGCEPEDEV